MPFPVIEVPYTALRFAEAMGTKRKFWYDDPSLGPALYKAVRRGPGEDWAEKAAQECAALLGVPHARYELAVCAEPERGPLLGVVSQRFLKRAPANASPGAEVYIGTDDRLVHGNELLADVTPAYAGTGGGTRATRSPLYTVDLVLGTVVASGATAPDGWSLPTGVRTAADVVVGYLLVDAWVGNTDRHDENWAVIERASDAEGGIAERVLAPYYDSASCLGRNEPDEKRLRRLRTHDANDTVERYADRARSAFFDPARSANATPVEAFAHAAARLPGAALAWLARLDTLDRGAVPALFARFPADRVSDAAREFAERVLEYNRRRLLALRPAVEAARSRTEDFP